MLYFIFFSINSLNYYAMTTYQQLMAVINRLADVFKMDEFKQVRIEDIEAGSAKITCDDSAFSWGYKVKEDFVRQKGTVRVAIDTD